MEDLAYDIALDGSGNMYLTGYKRGSDTHIYAFLTKFNSTWSEIFNVTKDAGTDYNVGLSIAFDNSGNITLTGEYDPNGDAFIAKYNNTGSFLFDETFETYGGGSGNDLVIDDSGNIIITESPMLILKDTLPSIHHQVLSYTLNIGMEKQ